MSFVFPSWSTAFSPAFHEDAKGMLEAALNKGNKPPVIQGRIEVVELSMGTQPPTLTLLEIGDLSLDRFRGILRLGYQGDAWLEVRCRVQANPLSHNPNLLPSSLPLSTPLLASQPLLVPMTLRLSLLHLRAILILVVSASKGITLVFKNDPLQNVDVSSTFDSVEVIRGYLQQEIEGQLREMFREDLPGIIHRLSQRWFHGSGVGGKVETPYRDGEYAASSAGTPGRPSDEEPDSDDSQLEKEIFPPYVPPPSNVNLTPRRRALQKMARARRSSTAASDSPTSYTVFPDIEDYDPTYGLRPEGLPTHSGYEAFGRLWEKAREGEGRGLGGLMSVGVGTIAEDRGDVSDEEWDGEEIEESGSFDMVEMEETLRPLRGLSRANSSRTTATSSRNGDVEAVEWETFPAVGGGVISRPRVYHSQSQIRAPSEAGGAMPSPSGTGSVTARASSIGGASTVGSMRPSIPSTPGLKGLPAFRPSAGPGPSSLRRLATSRSDVFTHNVTRSESFSPPPYSQINSPLKPSQSFRHNLTRHQSQTTGSRTGSSWETQGGPSRSATMSTLASTQLPSSRSMSLDIKPNQNQNSANNQTSGHNRSPSFASTTMGNSFPPRHSKGFTLPLNNSVSQLATLSHSNHTLSPYARGHEHIAVRSFPHLGKTNSSTSINNHIGSTAIAEEGKIKAKRKRIYTLGKKEPVLSPDPESPGSDVFVDTSRRLSSDSGHQYHQQSLTGATNRVMRPGVYRADSRMSYGFPRIAE